VNASAGTWFRDICNGIEFVSCVRVVFFRGSKLV